MRRKEQPGPPSSAPATASPQRQGRGMRVRARRGGAAKKAGKEGRRRCRQTHRRRREARAVGLAALGGSRSEPARPGRDPPWSTRWRRDAATSVPAPRAAPRASEEGAGGVVCAEGAWPRRAAARPGRAGAGRRDAVGVVTTRVTALWDWGCGLDVVGVVMAGVTALSYGAWSDVCGRGQRAGHAPWWTRSAGSPGIAGMG